MIETKESEVNKRFPDEVLRSQTHSHTHTPPHPGVSLVMSHPVFKPQEISQHLADVMKVLTQGG